MSTKRMAALAGVACAAVAVAVAELAAAIVNPASAPLVAVGAVAVDATPEPVKDWAIRNLGSYNKLALLAGIAVVLTAVAVVIGILARKRPWLGYVGLAGFGLLGAASALGRPAATLWWIAPSLVGTACGAVALWLLFRKPVESEPVIPGRVVDRRGVLVAFGLAGVGGVLGWRFGGAGNVEESRDAITFPAPDSPGPSAASEAFDVDGLTPYFTDNEDFYRVDTALTVPQVDTDEYRLHIGGRVANELSFSYQDLLDLPLMEREITLSCVSNEVGGDLAGNARWLGVSLKDLLERAEPEDGADQVVTRSADGWTCGTPTAECMDGRDAMLAVAMNGEPLPLEHGFPVRMLVPGLFGYVSATKWLVEIELSSFDAFDAYWVRRDWAAQAPVKTFSRIDTPSLDKPVDPGTVTVAGVAWAQHRGVAAVEVRVDEGEWEEAELAPVISSDTWRQWTWQWEAEEGRHQLQVRATDNDGETQPEERQPPFPDGATGWHSVTVVAE